MTRHILVPVDGSSHSSAGLTYAFVSFPDATFTAIYVIDTDRDSYRSAGSSQTNEERWRDQGERILEDALEVADDAGVDLETILEHGTPHSTILEYIVDQDVDHVVMGSHGESPIVRPFLGHVSEAVVRRASVSTTIVPEPDSALRERDLPGRILVPVDGSEQSLAALEYATTLFPDGRFTLLHTITFPFDTEPGAIEGTYLEPLVDDLTEQGEGILEDALEVVADESVVVETELQFGEPARTIEKLAQQADFDQVIMGSHGRSLPSRIITGSVAETVSRRATNPVTLVRGAFTEGE